MSFTHDLLDKTKEAWQCRTDAELARRLGLKPAAVSNYRQGTRHPQPDAIEKMATAIGEQPILWALRIQGERDANVDPANSKVWLRWAEHLSKTAAAVTLVMGLAVYTPKSVAKGQFYETFAYIHYANLQ